MNTQILKLIDIDRGFSKNLNYYFVDKKLIYITDFYKLMEMFEIITQEVLKRPDSVQKNYTKLVPVSSVSELKKLTLMKDIPKEYVDILFDLYDNYITVLAKIILKLREGFVELNQSDVLKKTIDFNMTIGDNIHLLFYMLFYHTFDPELLQILKNRFRINNIEDRMIKKCNDNIILTHNKICNIYDVENKYTTINNIYDIFLHTNVPIDTKYGVIILLKTIIELKKN